MGKPQSRALPPVTLRVAELGELVKYVGEQLPGDPHSCVDDTKDDPPIGALCNCGVDSDFARLGELDGVVDDVPYHATELHAVCTQQDGLEERLDHEAQPLVLREREELAALLLDQVLERELALHELYLSRVEPRHVEEVAHQLHQGFGVSLQLQRKLGNLRRHTRVTGRPADHFRHHADRVRRCADVVGDSGEEARLSHARFLGFPASQLYLALERLDGRNVDEAGHGPGDLTFRIEEGGRAHEKRQALPGREECVHFLASHLDSAERAG